MQISSNKFKQFSTIHIEYNANNLCFIFVFLFSLANRIRCPGISEILPCLYLCGAGVAIPIFLNKLGITCVINAAPELGDTPLSMPDDSKPLYLQIPVLDKGDINIGAYFDEVADLIEEVRAMDGKCMVHCVAGVSRSASLCLAYLMKHMKMTLKSAYELVKAVRLVLGILAALLHFRYSSNVFSSVQTQAANSSKYRIYSTADCL